MNPVQTKEPKKFITLKQAAVMLEVPVSTLLDWNDINILKPTITDGGEVGYTTEQIEKFISVSESFNNKSTNTGNEYLNPVAKTSPNNNAVLTSTDSGNQENDSLKKEVPNSKIKHPIGLVSLLLLTIISILFLIFIPGGNPTTPSVDKLPASDESPAVLSKVDNNKIEENDEQFTNLTKPETLSQEQISVPSTNSATPLSSYNDESVTSESAKLKRLAEATTSAGSGTQKLDKDNSVYKNYSSRSNTSPEGTTRKIVLNQDNGEIAGGTNVLASNLAAFKIGSSQTTQEKTGRNIIIVSITLGALWLFYIFNNYPVYSVSTSIGASESDTTGVNLEKQKLLEVNQRTDGTVVVIFNGKPYKISKPELNSETDRFIQRIMDLVTDDTKEVEYDLLKDDKLNLNAPLSKIVTRLGFVGVKRDLFFPRTSKNKVVFRKFITEEELSSLDLSSEQLVNELTN